MCEQRNFGLTILLYYTYKMLNKIITCKVPSCLLKTNIRVWLNCLMRIQRDSLIRRVVLGPNFFYVAFDMHPIQENRALRPPAYHIIIATFLSSYRVTYRTGAAPAHCERNMKVEQMNLSNYSPSNLDIGRNWTGSNSRDVFVTWMGGGGELIWLECVWTIYEVRNSLLLT